MLEKDESIIVMKHITKFNENAPARVSREFYDIEKCRMQHSVYGNRLLLMIAQNIDYAERSDAITLTMRFDTIVVMRYLGIENLNKRWNLLNKILTDFQDESHIELIERKNGEVLNAHRMVLFPEYEIRNREYIQFTILNKAKKMLCELKHYAQAKPLYYMKLNTEYQYWFYLYLKLRIKTGMWSARIEDLIYALKLNEEAYYTGKDANGRFLAKVLGISKPKDWKYKDDVTNGTWDYIKDKNGNNTGTLWTITEKTDIEIKAYPTKVGKKYERVVFIVSNKSEKKIAKKIEQEKVLKGKSVFEEVEQNDIPNLNPHPEAQKVIFYWQAQQTWQSEERYKTMSYSEFHEMVLEVGYKWDEKNRCYFTT